VRERLRALLVFSDLDDEQLDVLASCTREFRVVAGQPLIQRGDPGSGVFVLEEGRALVQAPEGTRELGPGDVFGEMSLLQKSPAVATIRTVSKAWVLVLPREDFNEVLSTHPQLLEQLSEVADERRRRNDEHGGVGAERLDPV
jgi:CRP-like cAMP-binding protein